MDIALIATQAVGFLLPLLSKAGGRMVDGALGAVGDRLVTLLKERLSDNEGKAALAKLENQPGSDAAAAVLKEALVRQMSIDPGFAGELRVVTADAEAAGLSNRQNGDGNKNAQIKGCNNTVSM